MAVDLKSMDKKKVIVIIAAIVAGLIAVTLTNQYIETNSQNRAVALTEEFSKKQVAELRKSIEILASDNSQIKSNLSNLQKEISAGPKPATQEPAARPQAALAAITPAGLRAVTILMDRLAAVGGLVGPSNYVDILAHLTVPADPYSGKGEELVSVTLFQNVLVLAVDGETARGAPAQADKDKKSDKITITFALNPQDATLITFAQKHRTIQLVLRSSLDNQAYIIPAATWKALSDYILSIQGKPVPVEKIEEEPEIEEPTLEPKIEIFRGGSSY